MLGIMQGRDTTSASSARVFHPFLALAALGLATCACFAAEPVAPKKHAVAASLNGALTIDGKLDEPAWQQAPEQTGFEMPLGMANRKPIPPDQQTSFRVLYDDTNLYFGIRCNEPAMNELVATAARQHDAAMWSDDDVELFLDPVGDRTEYYQLTVNTDGTQVDLYYIEGGNTGKAGWSSDWQAAVHKGKDFWSVEIALPFGLFHNRPSKMWTDNWVFSLSRTRMPPPGYFSQFSPGNRYHDIASFGTLGPIRVDKNRYNLYAEAPRFNLTPSDKGFEVTASLVVENRGDTPFDGTLTMELLSKDSKGTRVPLQIAPGSSRRIDLPGSLVMQQGKWPAIFRAQSKEGYVALVSRFDEWFTYTPLTLKLITPSYRNCIYQTEKIDTIKGLLKVGLALEKVKGLVARVSLSSTLTAPRSVESTINSAEVPFELPATDMPEGTYRVRGELLRPVSGTKEPDKKYDLVAEVEVALHKLAPGPVIEARIDDQGNLRINGSPIFIRGWYGSLGYMVSTASLPQAQLPHSTNFIMGAGDFEQTDLGMYTLMGVDRLVDEAKAKLDQPIDGELKAKLRAAIARARLQRNTIGYYLSDEPECRGLSPVFLKSLYDFVSEEDPYRFCMIVSRDPVVYMVACDVVCPHPYMNPQILEDGTRRFGSPLRSIHNNMAEAISANDGSKAIWSMPQTFSYGGLQGQHPSFLESRWFAYTSIACGAKGIVPFIFNAYWSHLENRIAMDSVFEDLTLLAPAWTARNSAAEVTCDNPGIDVIAKTHKPEGSSHSHTFIVAANQSYDRGRAIIALPAFAKAKLTRLLVLRENRVVEANNGRFTDDFPGLGVHVYTTLEVLPDLRTLDEIQAEIAAALKRPAKEGNLLASGKVKWCLGEWGRPFQSDGDLADGVTNAAAWLPVYEDRTQCVILFEKPVSFSRVVLHSPTIRSADLDVWVEGAWKTIHQWKDQLLYRLEYRGRAVKTDRIRIRPTESRQGYGDWVWNEITELGIYK